MGHFDVQDIDLLTYLIHYLCIVVLSIEIECIMLYNLLSYMSDR